MTSEVWPLVPLTEITERIAMGPFGSSIKVDTFKNQGVPVISGQHLTGFVLKEHEYNFISEEHATSLKKANVKRGDVIFTHAGNIGQVAYIPENSMFERYIISQRQFFLRCNRKRVLPEYIVYYFHSHEGKFKLLANKGGSGVPSLSGPVTYLRKLQIPLPPLDIQTKIVKHLNDLENLLENHNSLIDCLNLTISEIFRSWFIDFNPVKSKSEGKLPYGMTEETAALFPDSFKDSELGLIPTGWEVKSLLEVSYLYDNLRVPLSGMEREERKGIYPYYGATSVMDYVDDFIYDGVHLLIAEDGSVVNEDGTPVLQYVWGKFWVNNHAHVLQGMDDVTTEHLHQYVKHFYIQPFVTGAVQLKINQKALNNVKLVIAPRNLNNAFNEIIQPMYEKIRVSRIHIDFLTLTRDALLPRLMSGELKVPMEA